MKSVIYTICALSTCAILSASCEYRIELKGEGFKEKLFVECYPGKEEECHVRLQKAIPTNGNVSDDTVPRNVEMTVTVNDTPVEVRHIGDKSYESCYSFDYKASPNDKIRVEVAADGVKTVTVESIVPASPVILDIRQSTYDGAPVFSVKLADNSSEDDFYMFMILHRVTEENYSNWSGEQNLTVRCDTSVMMIERLHAEPVVISPDDAVLFPDWYKSNELMFNDKSFKDGTRTLHAEVAQYIDFYNQFPEDVPKEESKTYQSIVNEYKIVVRHIAPEYYRYVKVRSSWEGNELGNLGWAPTFYAFTNINNGIGIMGTVCTWESEWLPNDFTAE